MLKAIEKTSKYTLTLIDNIIDAMNNTKKILKDKLPKIYSKDLLELLFFEFYTKNEYIRTKLNISRQTATSYLKQLEEVGILSSEKIGKVYWAYDKDGDVCQLIVDLIDIELAYSETDEEDEE